MKSILAILCFATMILLLMYGIVWDVDWRTERLAKRKQINSWLCDRALNEYQTNKEWTR
jgi:hypothetical protein